MWQGTPSAQNDHLKQAVATYYKHYQTCLFVTVTPKNDSFFQVIVILYYAKLISLCETYIYPG